MFLRIHFCPLLHVFSLFFLMCASCPLSNVTDEQLLRDNRALKFLYDQFSVKHGGKINLDGLKNLISRLYIITTCSSGGRGRDFFSRPYSRFPNEDYRRGHYERRRPNYYDMSGHYRDGHYQDRDYNYEYRNDRFLGKGNPRYPDRLHDHDSHLNDESEPRTAASGQMIHAEHGDPFQPKGELYGHNEDYNKRTGSINRPKGDYDHRADYFQSSNYRRGSFPKGKGFMVEDCETIESAILNSGIVKEDVPLGPHDLLHLCPSIVRAVLNPPCEAIRRNLRMMVSRNTQHGYDERSHNHHHRHYADYDYEYHMTRDAWIGAILSLILIGLIALMCILVIPVLKRSKYYIAVNHFLLSLAVGSLAGDALIHLLPHALTMELSINISAHLAHAMYGFTAFAGIMLFLLMERLHNIFGHKHTPTPAQNTYPENDEFVKELGVISTSERNEGNPKRAAKIGKKLSQHSKTSSFTHIDPATDTRGCFDNCPPIRSSAPPPAPPPAPPLPSRGSTLDESTGFDSIHKPRLPERHSSTAERERLVAVNQEIMEKVTKGITPNPISAPPLIQNSPPKPLVRQDSKSFNIVLQEYHIGHHGHSHHGHSHVTGKKDALRTMILLGDGIHTFIDGMAIGAAFGTSLTGGIATAIAVLCHELPHKVGDFAILFEMGMKRNQAMKMVLILWLLSFCGLAVGVSLGSIQSVSPWVYCFTAGIFLYLALVDLLSELTINDDENCSAICQMILQMGGMMTGSLIMLVIAIYEHDLENLLEGSFETRDLAHRRYYHRAYNYADDYNRQ